LSASERPIAAITEDYDWSPDGRPLTRLRAVLG
jgi:hypothetical protein